MKGIKNFLIFFLIGGTGYALIEILWRGKTHWSMFTLGGICFNAFGKIAKIFNNMCLLYKSLIAVFFITSAELIYGLIFNILLKKEIWDYSSIPFNFKGQICLLYSCFWWFLSLFFIPLANKLNNNLQNHKKVL
ncbi:MAG: hypothetical protein IJP26_01975 [Clostridia bacterium]|nr:hypothetical protein [Clostridia bacterium]